MSEFLHLTLMTARFQVAVEFAILFENRLLLGKRATTKDYAPGIWEIPSGRLEDHEEPMQALLRECEEELGIRVTPLLPYNSYFFERGKGNPLIVISYLCKINKNDISKIQKSSEHDELKWVPLSEVLNYLHFEQQKRDFKALQQLLAHCSF